MRNIKGKVIKGTGIVINQSTRKGTPSLLLILIILKAVGVLYWSWFWTIAFPLLLPFIVAGTLLVIVGVLFGLLFLSAVVIEFINQKRRNRFKNR